MATLNTCWGTALCHYALQFHWTCVWKNGHPSYPWSQKTEKPLCWSWEIKGRKPGPWLIPMVGMVVTISPNFSLYRMVVFPAASKPTIKMRISFFPIRLFNRFPKMFPMVTAAASQRVKGAEWSKVATWVWLGPCCYEGASIPKPKKKNLQINSTSCLAMKGKGDRE